MTRNEDIMQAAIIALEDKWKTVPDWTADIDIEEVNSKEQRSLKIKISAGLFEGLVLYQGVAIMPENVLETGEFVEKIWQEILIKFCSLGIESAYEKATEKERQQKTKSNFAQYPLLEIECKPPTNS